MMLKWTIIEAKFIDEIYSNADYKAMDPMAIMKCAESWIALSTSKSKKMV